MSGCRAGRQIPFGALVRWLPATGDPRPAQAVAEALAAGSALLVVDDLPLLDESSLAAVALVAARGDRDVIVTASDPHPASPAAAALLTGCTTERIVLGGLTVAETGELLGTRLAGPVDAGAVGRLWRATEGIPGYLTALVAHALRTGTLAEKFGVWTLLDDPAVPDSLGDRITARITGAECGAADAVDCLVEAGDLPVDLLAELTDPAAVAAAVDAGLVKVAAGTAAIAHPIITEVRRRSSGIAHRRHLREVLAAQLQQVDLSRRNLRVELGLASLAIDQPAFSDRDRVLLLGADAAVRSIDFAAALRYARAVGPGPFRTAAMLTEGYAASLTGAVERAEVVLAQAFRDAEEPILAQVAALLRIYNQVTGCGDLARGAELIEDCGELLSPASRCAALGLVAALGGDTAEARTQLAGLDDDQTLGELDRMFATMGAVIVAGGTGRPDEVHTAIRAVDARADRWLTAPHQRIVLGYLAIHSLLLCGETAAATAAAAEILRRAPALPGPGRHWLSGIAGVAAFAEYRMSDAQSLLRTALDGLDELRAPVYIRYPLWLDCGEAAAQTGDLASLDAMLAQVRETEIGTYEFLRPRRDLLVAWRTAGAGRTAAAADLAAGAADLAHQRGQPMLEAYCLQAAVRFGDARPAARLTELAALLPSSPRARLAAAHGQALAGGDPAALTAAAADYRTAGLVGAAVDADAQAALLLRRRGRSGAALSAKQRACRTSESHGLHTAAVESLHVADGLTPRQREVVQLAAAGLSNHQIAAATGLSVRTVEGHRYRASRIIGRSP